MFQSLRSLLRVKVSQRSSPGQKNKSADGVGWVLQQISHSISLYCHAEDGTKNVPYNKTDNDHHHQFSCIAVRHLGEKKIKKANKNSKKLQVFCRVGTDPPKALDLQVPFV